MAYTTEFVDAGRGVLNAGSGIITGAEIILGATQLLQAVQGGIPLRYGLVDFTGSEQFLVSTNEVKDIARINVATAEIARDVSAAIIAPADHAFGMARMWEAHANATAWDMRVFRDGTEARTWLAARAGDDAIAMLAGNVEAG